MVTGNAKCLSTIFQVGYFWLDNLLRFNFYSSLQLIHLRFTIHLIAPGIFKNLINNYTSLYLSLHRSHLLHASVRHQLSRNPVLGLVFRPPTRSPINGRPMISAEKLQRMSCTQGFKAATRSQPQLRAGRIPSHDNQSHKLIQVALKSTRKQHTNTFYRKRNSFARVLNCYFILPTCKFACLSA
jgi:hypothetical protein